MGKDAFDSAEMPPWLLQGDVAARIANEHRVSAGAVQAIAKAVHRQQAAEIERLRAAINVACSALAPGGLYAGVHSQLTAAIKAKATAPPLRETVTTTLRTQQMPDGAWVAQMLVTGLPDERTADAAVTHMQRLFCGGEIKGGH